jgi:hypothetical protein
MLYINRHTCGIREKRKKEGEEGTVTNIKEKRKCLGFGFVWWQIRPLIWQLVYWWEGLHTNAVESIWSRTHFTGSHRKMCWSPNFSFKYISMYLNVKWLFSKKAGQSIDSTSMDTEWCVDIYLAVCLLKFKQKMT